MSRRISVLNEASNVASSNETSSFEPPLASTMNHIELNQQLEDVQMAELSSPVEPDSQQDDVQMAELSSPVEPDSQLDESDFDYEAPDPMPEYESGVYTGLAWNIFEDSSQRDKDKLVETTGHTYVFREEKCKRAHLGGTWRCSHNRKGSICPATVLPRGGVLKRNSKEHICIPKHKPEVVLKLRRDMKRRGKLNLHLPATKIAEEFIFAIPESDRARLDIPKITAAAEMVRRVQRKMSAKNPDKDDLHFALNMEYMEKSDAIPDNFVQGDIDLGDARHLVFFSKDQLKLMKKAKTWYIDATFKVVNKPFYQLFSVHVFIKEGKCMKQVPVAFVLMSRRRKIDYEAVFKHLVEKLGNQQNVKRVVADFEAAAWVAVRNVLGHTVTSVKGCLFHFNQAVYRQICKLDLKISYINDPEVRRLCRSLMALPMLPENHIKAAFELLVVNIEAGDPLKIPKCKKLVTYMRNTWINGRLFNPASWCWYHENIRTNNDVEGWHSGLNVRANKANLPLYELLSILGTEAKVVTMNVELVKKKDLTRYQSCRTVEKQQKLSAFWDQYEGLQHHNPLKALKLLEDVSNLSKPSESWDNAADYTSGDYQAVHEETD